MVGLQRIGGGVVGAGSTAAIRARVDEPGTSRYRQPSVLWGLGSGVAAGAAYFLDIDIPVVSDGFLASHVFASVPLGITFAALPKQQGKSTTDQVLEQISGFQNPSSRRDSGSGGSGGSSNGSNGSNGSSSGSGGSASAESIGSARVNGTSARRGAGTY